jgi:hypothetical protein
MNKQRRDNIIINKAVLIILFALVFIISCNKSNVKPKIGEVYIIKQNDSFTTWIITNLKEDTVYFVVNDYIVSDKNKIYKINKPESYTDLSLSISINNFNNIKDKTLIKIPTK